MHVEDGWPEYLVLLGFSAAPFATYRAARWFVAAQRGRPRVGVVRIVTGNLLVLVFLLSVVVLSGEIWCRFVRDTTSALNSEKVSRRWFARHWVKNSAGLRDDVEYSRFPPPGKRRLVFLGDSFTAGQGIEVGERFANRIRVLRPDDDVQAVAGLGWSTEHQMRTLRNFLQSGYDLDRVVLCYCLNDIEGTVAVDSHSPVDDFFAKWTTPPPIVRHSYFLDWVYWRVLMAAYGLEVPAGLGILYVGESWDRQQERLSELRRTVESGGGRFAVVTFPYFNNGSEYEFREAHAELDHFWKSVGVPHLDLLPTFEKHPPSTMVVNHWDPHPNARAHALAADAIEAFLDGL